MTALDLDAARRWLQILDPERECWWFRALNGTKARNLRGTLDELAPQLSQMNCQGYSIFATVQCADPPQWRPPVTPPGRSEGIKTEHVTRIIAVFADLDGAPLEPAMRDLDPHLVVETSPGRWHVYWLVDGLELGEYTGVQKAIAARYGADPQVSDLPRIMRVPGFVNRKYTSESTAARIVHDSGAQPYPARTIRHAWPAPAAPPPENSHANGNGTAVEAVDAETIADLRSALLHLRADDRELWVRMGHACKTLGDVGRGLWLEWSATSDKFDPADAARTWDGFKPRMTDYRVVFSAAQASGWVNPKRVKKRELTEDTLALSFCAAEPLLRYVAIWNRWMTWSATRWTEDTTLAVYDRVRAHVRASRAPKEMLKASVIAAVERLAKADRRYAATADQWDRADWRLNTPGGVVDLRTGGLHICAPDDYMTKLTAFTPAGECPTWMRFLEQVAGGDAAFVGFLQRVAGYAATGSTREHALFFAYGPGGNGKGVFLNTLHKVFGDYATVSGMDTFTETHTDRHPTDLAMLRGARLVLAQETEEGRSWAESRIKALTGGDPITARYMRQDFFTFEPKFKLLIAGNHKPRLRNVDEAMRRRLYLLPFMQTFKGDRRDPDLAEKLLAEGGGILRWIVQGAIDYQRQGLNPPAVVVSATAEYFAAQDTFDQWLEDCCDRGRDYWEPAGLLFASWKKYAETANESPGQQKGLGERMAKAGFSSGNSRGRGGRHWLGLRLKPVEEGAHGHWQR